MFKKINLHHSLFKGRKMVGRLKLKLNIPHNTRRLHLCMSIHTQFEDRLHRV